MSKKGKVLALLSGIVLLGGNTLSQAGALEELIAKLEEKGILSPEEAKQILAEAQKEREKGSLPENTIKKLEKLTLLKISGKIYLHYDYTRNSPEQDQKDLGEFKLTKAKITLKKYFEEGNKDNYFRFTTDAYQDDNGSWNVRVKYAYLNWKFSNIFKTEIGLAHRPWVSWEEEHIWFHRDVDKAFIEDKDGAHLLTSSDFGIAVKGNYKKFFDYMVGIYNGEGYHEEEDDKHFGKSVEGRISFYPWKGVILALHTAQIFNNGEDERNLHIYQGLIAYHNPYFLIAGQYIYDHEEGNSLPSYNHYGFVLNGDIKFRKFSLFGRYGYWNFDDKYTEEHLTGNLATDYKYTDRYQWLGGIAYKWNKYIRTSLAYKYVKYDISKTSTETGKNYKDIFMAVMQVKW